MVFTACISDKPLHLSAKLHRHHSMRLLHLLGVSLGCIHEVYAMWYDLK